MRTITSLLCFITGGLCLAVTAFVPLVVPLLLLISSFACGLTYVLLCKSRFDTLCLFRKLGIILGWLFCAIAVFIVARAHESLAFSSSRQLLKRLSVQKEMKDLGELLLQYAHDHGNSLPQNLRELASMEIGNDTECLDWESYVYLGGGLHIRDAIDEGLPVVLTKPELLHIPNVFEKGVWQTRIGYKALTGQDFVVVLYLVDPHPKVCAYDLSVFPNMRQWTEARR